MASAPETSGGTGSDFPALDRPRPACYTVPNPRHGETLAHPRAHAPASDSSLVANLLNLHLCQRDSIATTFPNPPDNIRSTYVDIAELKSKSVAELHEMAEELNISNYSGLRKQDLIFRIEQNLLDSRRRAARRGRARDPARRLRLPPLAGLELPVRPGRHLRQPVADQALRSAHRRHGPGPGPAAQGGRALPRAAQGRAGQRRRSGQGQAPHRLRQPAPALPRDRASGWRTRPKTSPCG